MREPGSNPESPADSLPAEVAPDSKVPEVSTEAPAPEAPSEPATAEHAAENVAETQAPTLVETPPAVDGVLDLKAPEPVALEAAEEVISDTLVTDEATDAASTKFPELLDDDVKARDSNLEVAPSDPNYEDFELLRGAAKQAFNQEAPPFTAEPPVEYESVRDALLATIDDQRLRNHADALYRPGAEVGDGGTADALRHEKDTGERVGGKSHEQSTHDRSNGLRNLMSEEISVTTREIAKDLKEDLDLAIKHERKE
jgi:hypothetical protein